MDKKAFIRAVNESDIQRVIDLFKLQYGSEFSHPEILDEQWGKRAIFNDNIIWLALEQENEIVASGAIILDYGDYDDHLGLIGRLVSHPEKSRGGYGSQIVKALLSVAGDNLECVIGTARTAHKASQRIAERNDFAAVGYLPQYESIGGKAESLILYEFLFDDGRLLKTDKLPQLIPEVAAIAKHSLSLMGLTAAFGIVDNCPPYINLKNYEISQVDRRSLAILRQIDFGRLSDPLVFGNVSIDYGLKALNRKGARYLMSTEDNQPIGAIGFRIDPINKILKITELVFNRSDVIHCLCKAVIEEAEASGIDNIEVDVSAYDARIQETFLRLGFCPVAYIPAMVFHNTYRLDAVKMMKIKKPDLTHPQLFGDAEKVYSIVREEFYKLIDR